MLELTKTVFDLWAVLSDQVKIFQKQLITDSQAADLLHRLEPLRGQQLPLRESTRRIFPALLVLPSTIATPMMQLGAIHWRLGLKTTISADRGQATRAACNSALSESPTALVNPDVVLPLTILLDVCAHQLVPTAEETFSLEVGKHLGAIGAVDRLLSLSEIIACTLARTAPPTFPIVSGSVCAFHLKHQGLWIYTNTGYDSYDDDIYVGDVPSTHNINSSKTWSSISVLSAAERRYL